MSKPFDATMRTLIDLEPAAWLRFLHIPVADPDRVKVIDSTGKRAPNSLQRCGPQPRS